MTTPFDVLSRITSTRWSAPAGQRCEMCAEAIPDEHQHVVSVADRRLMCSCRGCWLLFTDSDADLRYRAVLDRCLSFPDFAVDRAAWEALQIPVGVAFFFRNSALGRVVGFYPGPAGACESELDLGRWETVAGADARTAELTDDIEALLIRMPADGRAQCFLVPIDVCYEFVGGLRSVWRGFDGGADARAFIDAYFAALATRAEELR